MGSSVLVPRLALAEADLPDVCVRTGRPADARIEFRHRSTPGWTWLLLPFGIVPFVLANLFAGELVVGEVPVTRELVERQRRVRRLAALLLATGILVVVIGVVASAPWVVGTGLAVAVTGFGLYAYDAFTWIGARPDRTGLWVRMTRVHPDFAAATEVWFSTP